MITPLPYTPKKITDIIHPIDVIPIPPDILVHEAVELMKQFNCHLEARNVEGVNGWVLVRNEVFP